MVLEGADRTTAARAAAWSGRRCGTGCTATTRTGSPGCADRPRSGRKPRLTPEQLAELKEVVEAGPDLARGRRGPLAARRPEGRRSRTASAVALSERSVGRMLSGRGYVRLSARPQHPGGRSRGPRDVQKNFAAAVAAALPERRAGQAGRDLVPRRSARRPARHVDPGLGEARHAAPGGARQTLRVGLPVRAVCPERASAPGWCYRSRTREAMNLHLAEVAALVAAGAHAVLVLDGAGWHRRADLEVPRNSACCSCRPARRSSTRSGNLGVLRKNQLSLRVYGRLPGDRQRLLPSLERADRHARARTSITAANGPTGHDLGSLVSDERRL